MNAVTVKYAINGILSLAAPFGTHRQAFGYIWHNEVLSCEMFLESLPIESRSVKHDGLRPYLQIQAEVSYIADRNLTDDEASYIVIHDFDQAPILRAYTPFRDTEWGKQTLADLSDQLSGAEVQYGRFHRPPSPRRSGAYGGLLLQTRSIAKSTIIDIVALLEGNGTQPFTDAEREKLIVDHEPTLVFGAIENNASVVTEGLVTNGQSQNHSLHLYRDSCLCMQVHFPFDYQDGQSYHLC